MNKHQLLPGLIIMLICSWSLSVSDKARVDPSVTQQSQLGAALQGTVTFTLTVLANPVPTGARWTKNGADLGPRLVDHVVVA